MNLRYPELTGDLSHQLSQLKDYLYYLVDELQFNEGAIKTAISGGGSGITSVTRVINTGGSSSPAQTPDEIFNNIKDQIIKVADAVVAVESKNLTDTFTSQYEAISNEFGTYKEKITHTINTNSTEIEQRFKEVKSISTTAIASATEAKQYVTETEAYIKSGKLPGGQHGIEIGQADEYNGTSTFKAFARFTANALSFFDANGAEAFYIKNDSLHINNIVIDLSFKIGGLVTVAKDNGDVIERWV